LTPNKNFWAHFWNCSQTESCKRQTVAGCWSSSG